MKQIHQRPNGFLLISSSIPQFLAFFRKIFTMSSMAAIPSGSVKPGGTLTYPSFIPSKNNHPCFLPFRTSVISINPTRASTYKHSSSTINLNLKHQTRNITARKFTASATTEAVETEISSDPAPTSKESEPSLPTAVNYCTPFFYTCHNSSFIYFFLFVIIYIYIFLFLLVII